MRIVIDMKIGTVHENDIVSQSRDPPSGNVLQHVTEAASLVNLTEPP